MCGGCRLRDGVVGVGKARGRSCKRQLIKWKPKQELQRGTERDGVSRQRLRAPRKASLDQELGRQT